MDIFKGSTGRIEKLLNEGVAEMSIAKDPKGIIYVQAKQMVVTKDDTNRSNVVHQCSGPTLVACLEDLTKRASHVGQLQTKIIQPPPRN